MSVRQMHNSEKWEYRFNFKKKPYYGTADTKEEAEAEEARVRTELEKLQNFRNKAAVYANYAKELNADKTIPFDQVFSRFLEKPGKTIISESQKKVKLKVWNDFVDFMNAKYPDILNLEYVTEEHAGKYINHLRTKGKFTKDVVSNYKGKKIKGATLKSYMAPGTYNKYHTVLQEIYKKLMKDIAVVSNPFAAIEKTVSKKKVISKQPFSDEEIELIMQCDDDLVKRISILGNYSGLRRGDICTLKKQDVEWCNSRIHRWQNKTEGWANPPLVPPLEYFLRAEFEKNPESEYVMPDIAEQYLRTPNWISERFKRVLNANNIENTINIPGRRKQSIKDIHSFRHSYAKRALDANIPLAVLKEWIGHAAIEMTLHYQDHVSPGDSQKFVKQMDFGVDISKATPRTL